ncbi:GntR family transcriptional regulator [Pseudolysinimonas sp.]|uniref:GntR family transcriptional regulator n=1 Tax=Pseudolysinimonas sp. TaxID=2680009 RepID=UPI003F80BE91
MTTQSEGAYEGLRARILALDLAPGERISERGLESELGASRTPVRAALSRLQSEGLVRRDERGWSVAPLDLAELRHVGELREAVESAALRLAAARADPAALARLDQLLDRQPDDPEGGVRWGEEFHVELAALSGNPLLAEAIRGVMTTLSRTRWLEVTTPASRAEQLAEHRAILDAVRAGDAETAVARAVAHARAGAEHAERLLRGDRARGLRVVGA